MWFCLIKYPEQELGIMPPILAPADLVAVGDPRNIEVGEMLWDEYRTQYFERESPVEGTRLAGPS